MILDIKTQNGNTIYEPVVKDGVTLTREKNKPAVLKFTVLADENFKVEEGDIVSFQSSTLDPTNETHNCFYGYVFGIAPNKTKEITITAYDQIRYLLSSDTYIYADKTLTQFLRMLCSDTQIKSGNDIMETFYVIPSRVEDNQTYLDMLLTAIQLTRDNTGVDYILWDNFGEIALHDTNFFKIPLKVDNETAQDFTFESSIDSETFNQIKVVRENEDGTREVFIRNDPNTIGKWGLLQFYDTVANDENGDAKADTLLAQKNKKTRTMSLSGAFGDIRVRGGSTVYVQIDDAVDMGFNIEGYTTGAFMQVTKATHNFNNGLHTMDLEITGGGLING